MAIVLTQSNYDGEVLESLLTRASTGNELADEGLICIIPNVQKKITIPRLKTDKMLQKRKEEPTLADSKGNFNVSHKKLEPKDFMAFTVFNPRTFENYWRKYQPKGPLVFAELPAEGQNKLLEAMAKQVEFELGDHYINGEYVDGSDDTKLFDGILKQMKNDPDVIVVAKPTETTITARLKAIYKAIPKSLKKNVKLKFLMSVEDWDKYDDELTARDGKNLSETEVNKKRFKNIPIHDLAAWPEGLIIATVCSPDEMTSNLFAAVAFEDDENVIVIDKLSNAGELYFCKMLMKVDTNIAFGEEVIILDARQVPVFTPTPQG